MDIYVGNFSFETTEEDLRAEFEIFGEVTKVKIIRDRFTNKSRGFGFVEMQSEGEALAAIDGLNGKEMGERTLKVNKARPRNTRQSKRSSSQRKSNGGRVRQSRDRDGKYHDGVH